jgi:hypothetical protein
MADASAALTISTAAAALAPAFAAGFAVQQGLQILDSFVGMEKIAPAKKTGLAGLVSLALGVVFATHGITVLSALSTTTKYPVWVDVVVSALVISGGTEGFNSIMKFIGYKKDAAGVDSGQKNAADPKQPPNQGEGGPNVVNQAA